MFNYNIVLIGFMGAGKSTIAELLRTKYRMERIEMDALIEERENMSISKIFETKGEPYFRNLETALLIELQAMAQCGDFLRRRSSHAGEKCS